MKFRYDINALRAIAVMGVLLFHYKVPFFSGGFAGVDVFFVISGYLMTRIITEGIHENRFSFKEFYRNRVNRIVPALLGLVVGLTVLCFFFYFPTAYRLFQTNSASSIAFVSNMVYWRQSNYFDPKADTNLLLHTWSLSVEWQFYLIYPLLLLGLGKLVKRKETYLGLFVSATLLIFFFSVYYNLRNQTATFYLLPFRCWEMLFGGIAFLTQTTAYRFKYKKLGAIVAYISIFFCFILLNIEMSWPGIFTLIPVFFTFLVIVLNVNNIAILQYKAVQFTGRISYSLYLWHWPVYVLARDIGVTWNALSICVCIVISFFLAFLSYWYIESAKNYNYKRILTAMAVLFIVCIGLSYFNVNRVIFKPGTLAIADYAQYHSKEKADQFSEGKCFVTVVDAGVKALNIKSCLSFEKSKRNYLLIGDSHAAELSASLKVALMKRNINLLQATTIGCLPINNTIGKKGSVEIINYLYQDFIKNNANRLDGVIIAADWINTEGRSKEELLKGINSTLAYLGNYKLKTIVVGQTETYTIAYSFIAARQYQYGIDLRKGYLNKQPYEMNIFLRQYLKPYYIDIYNGDSPPKLTINNVPYMFDSDHFTRYGADLVVDKILINPLVAKFLGI